MNTKNSWGSPPPSVVHTSSSHSSATASNHPHTPRQASSLTLEAIFQEAGLSPPAESGNVLLADVIKEADSLLQDGWTWDRLNPVQQTRLGFLVLKKQIHLLRQKHPETWPTALHNAVSEEDTMEYKTLTSFLQKGGDQPGNGDTRESLGRHRRWNENNDYTFSLFAMTTDFDRHVEPFARFQTTESVVCWCICASHAILYYMMLTTGTKRDDAIGQYGINIGRFQRNNFSSEEIFRTIFSHDGGFPEGLIDRLLSTALSSSQSNKQLTFPIYLEPDLGVDAIFSLVKTHIKKRGAIVACNFRVFPAYLETSTTEFFGDWDRFKEEDTKVYPHHAFLITSVHKTQDGSMGGILFEVSDSMIGRPFVNIGFDMLVSMNVTYVGIRDGVVFHGTSTENCFDYAHTIASPTSGCASITSQEFAAAATPTFSDVTWNPSSGDVDQNDNEANERHETGKPDWLGIDIPEGTDMSTFCLYS